MYGSCEYELVSAFLQPRDFDLFYYVVGYLRCHARQPLGWSYQSESLIKLTISSKELSSLRLINGFSMCAHSKVFFSGLYVALHRAHVMGSAVLARLVPTERERFASGFERVPSPSRIAVFFCVLLFLVRNCDIAILGTVRFFKARRGLCI
jgi:hypothetical protein